MTSLLVGVGVSGADAEENDGVYSRYFTNFTSDGTYTVKIEVDGDNDTQVATNSSSGGSGQQRADAQPGCYTQIGATYAMTQRAIYAPSAKQ